ncbi:hypothetical protein SAY87_016254 [Trapa incisa]|uniref:Uncharacterized protein n=1 Tax=Trapa incisa TaxID=236973 RepID=A0AAN7L0Y8_9MYRT|nr:hypothetical protein SAY87_016254 [Trapa incisa]
MASHRREEAGLSGMGPSTHHVPYSLPLHGIRHANSFMNQIQEDPAFDYGELEEAIVLQGVKIRNHEAAASPFLTPTGRTAPAATLDMFPSWPLKFNPNPVGSSKSGEESTDSGSAVMNAAITGKAEALDSPVSMKLPVDDGRVGSSKMVNDASTPSQNQLTPNLPQEKKKGGSSTSEKQLDAKTLRRLAQNREAARKSRLRKKAYVQQLESSRMKLSQMEQDLQRARSQGLFLGVCGSPRENISSGAAMFDMEYARWLEDDQRFMSELRTALQAHLSDGDMRVVVDGYISHYDEIFRLKGTAAKSDVFHLITGTWATPAERCFLWMGGFRPSELIKMLMAQLDPLTEQQVMGIYSLQQSSQQAEEALSQGLEQLQRSLVDTIAGGPNIIDSMQQMAIAVGKLANLEGFVRQADNLRQQMLHQLCRILTVRQAARCFLVIGEYYGRLRALSSLWASRPCGAMVHGDNYSCQKSNNLQTVHPTENQYFTSL